MDNTLQVLKFIKSNNKPGEFIEIRYCLYKIGFLDYDSMNFYVDALTEIGYLRLKEDVFSSRALESEFGMKDTEETPLSEDYGFLVRLTPNGERYLLENERIETTLGVSKKAAGAAWLSGIIATAAVILNIYQVTTGEMRDNRISKQGSAIISLQAQLLLLSQQEDSLLKSHKERPYPRQNTSSPQGEKK